MRMIQRRQQALYPVQRKIDLFRVKARQALQRRIQRPGLRN